MSIESIYQEFVQKYSDRSGLFELIASEYPIESFIYPGSYIHITPSFFFPISVYIENFKKAVAFFARSELLDFVNSKKKYDKKPIIRFHNSDYMKPVKEKDNSFDLLISQYAGFVSKHCKNYLKVGGLLLVNNSHGDASMAYLDDNFEFIGVFYKSKMKFYLTTKNLNKYFIPKKDIEITAEYLEKIQRGIGYTKTGSHYLFEKVE